MSRIQQSCNIIELVVDEASGGQRLDRFLASSIPDLSRSRLKQLIEREFVELSGKAVSKPGKRLGAGQAIRVMVPPPEPLELVAEDIPVDIVFEDRHLLVVNKAPGMVVHPGAGHGAGTLVNALLARCSDLSGIGGKMRPGIVHRLDKDTSGLMIVAKTDQAHQELVAMFKDRSILKNYLGLVSGHMPDRSGIIDLPIGRHPAVRVKMSVNASSGRPALTGYEVVRGLGPHQLVKMRLYTGRTHQIRVHMSHAGHPLLGDTVYGGPSLVRLPGGDEMTVPRQMLHSFHLEFRHPVTGEALRMEAPVPEDMQEVMDFLTQHGKGCF